MGLQDFEKVLCGLIKLANHIAGICSEEKKDFPQMDKKQACLEGKRFLVKNFELHNVKYASRKELEDFCSKEHTQREIKEYLENMETISPFKLPIAFYGNSFQNQVLATFPFVEDEELLSKLEILFSGIILEKRPTLLTPHHYVHEIVHTQLDSRKGAILYSYHQEVLSIFLELVSLFEKGEEILLNYVIQDYYCKLNSYIASLCDYVANKDTDLTPLDYEEYSNYTISTLKGLNLFRKYQKYPIFRKSILKSIQNVFNNQIPLENILKFYEVSAEEEMQFIMKL